MKWKDVIRINYPAASPSLCFPINPEAQSGTLDPELLISRLNLKLLCSPAMTGPGNLNAKALNVQMYKQLNIIQFHMHHMS